MKQNSEWCDNVGCLSGDVNTLRFDNQVVVAMVQTVFARFKKYGIDYLGKFDNIILDEVHILIFEKVFEQLDFKYLVGFTATPLTDKKVTIWIDDVEYSQPYCLDKIFNHMIQSLDTQDLIEKGRLIQDHNIVLELEDMEKLKVSESDPDGYTKRSLEEVYSNQANLDTLVEAYNRYGKGKKTMVFNATTKINKIVLDRFKSEGINAKSFDSVNKNEINPETNKPFTRKEILTWFDESDDACLINTNVFTTGFSNNEVETILMNRATKSLAMFIQIAGRGSRVSKRIFKDFFTFVDLGQNIHRHGHWSKRRDWSDYFFSPSPKPKRKNDMLSTWECENCETYNVIGTDECMVCGHPKNEVKRTKPKKLKKGEFIELKPKPIPRGNKIIEYAENLNQDANFAFRVLDKSILDLFSSYNVEKDFYIRNKQRFKERVSQIYRPIYFAIINSSLEGKRRKLNTQLESITTKIDKRYGIE